MNWRSLDSQMRPFYQRLLTDVEISSNAAERLATTIASEIRFLSADDKGRIRASSPVPLQDRLGEITAYEGWLNYSRGIRNPFVGRARVITQSHICFVYLPESCFRIIAKAAPSGSATRKCAQFLSNNPVRAFRNAFAHANWAYRQPDHLAILYWARKGSDPNEPLQQFEVGQQELDFWQALARCVAYAAFSNL